VPVSTREARRGLSHRAVLAGAAAIALVAAFAVTPRAEAFVYWTNLGPAFDGTTIGRANLNGTVVNHSFITGASGPCGVAVNGTHIYWANNAAGTGIPNNGTIARANLDGTAVNQSLVSAPDNPCGIALDGGHVYWGDPDRITVGRANLNGSIPQPDFISSTSACGVAVDGALIYWANNACNTI
jgi:virginiamycin B lyase